MDYPNHGYCTGAMQINFLSLKLSVDVFLWDNARKVLVFKKNPTNKLNLVVDLNFLKNLFFF